MSSVGRNERPTIRPITNVEAKTRRLAATMTPRWSSDHSSERR
jgi:hypothetical protein